MSRALLGLAVPLALAACDPLTGSFSPVVALEVAGPPTRRLEEGTATTLAARALDLAGDSIAADIRWTVLDTAAGITVDAASGTVTAVTPGGPWRVRPSVEALVGDPVAITVAAAPDSVAPAGDTVVTATGTAASGAMTVRVFDLTTEPGTERVVAGATVRFLVATPGQGLVLRASTAADSTAAPDSTAVPTSATGAAGAILRTTGTPPDSAVVHAVITTALGGAVTGSPVRFVVRFQ